MSEGEIRDPKEVGWTGPLNQDYVNAYGPVKAFVEGKIAIDLLVKLLKIFSKGLVETYKERYGRMVDFATQYGIDPHSSDQKIKDAIETADLIVAEMNTLLPNPEANKPRLALLVAALDSIVYKGEIPNVKILNQKS